MPTSGKLDTLDTKSGGTESCGGDVGGDDGEVAVDAKGSKVSM